ncbi:hypothetical protein ASF40_06360 [Microbacterium sp. Leaf288]|uniref:hypothetical protein n=1 Tax=Microbacterium sp. Leaf288 TaxID=1736323 RepID=UPI0006FA02ED|nr:hypothetical protein [Microbacterium sp. Leaf288]KQP71393.1 hypothetical protein ASF40_06360 [Microbacterium sp. Leaf288]
MSADNGRMPHHDAVQDLLIEKMRSDLSRPKWWQTMWGRLSIAGGALLVAGTAVAGVVLLETRPVSETLVVHCLDSPHRGADGSLPGAAVSIAAPDGVVPIEDAEAVCEQMWLSGSLQEPDALNPTPTPGDAPEEFTTCVTENGEAAVVPGRIECSVLHLHPYQPNVPTGR